MAITSLMVLSVFSHKGTFFFVPSKIPIIMIVGK